MKFISKFANYNIVLRPTVPMDRSIGRPAIPGLYARFDGGILSTENQEMIDLLTKHPKFNLDFVADVNNPQNWKQKETEPQHVIQEIKHGSVVSSTGKTTPINPEMELKIKEMVTKMAVEMAPILALEMVKKLAENQEKDNKKESLEETEKKVSKRGRKPKSMVEEKDLEETVESDEAEESKE